MSLFSVFNKIYGAVLGKISLLALKTSPQVTLGAQLKIRGFAMVELHKTAKLIIGQGVTLNSCNQGYHVNMFGPVKLFADMPNASITIGDNTRIHGACLHAYQSITIGANCLIAANTQIIDCSGHELSFSNVRDRINTKGSPKSVFIEDNVWIGTGCIILPGVTIGQGAVIAAGSVVTKNIPPLCVAGGNPAKVLKIYEDIKMA